MSKIVFDALGKIQHGCDCVERRTGNVGKRATVVRLRRAAAYENEFTIEPPGASLMMQEPAVRAWGIRTVQNKIVRCGISNPEVMAIVEAITLIGSPVSAQELVPNFFARSGLGPKRMDRVVEVVVLETDGDLDAFFDRAQGLEVVLAELDEEACRSLQH